MMAFKGNNIQDVYLNTLRKERIPVTVFLVNGTRLRGLIKSFDNFVIVLKQEKPQLIFKHAVSTIIPEKEVDLKDEASQEG